MSAYRSRWNNVPLRRKVLTIMSVPLLALIAASSSFLLVGRAANVAQDSVVDALRVRQAVQDVDSAMQDYDTLQWSGTIMGQPLANRLKFAQATLDTSIANLRRHVSGDPRQADELNGFEDKVARKNAVMSEMVTKILAEIRRTGSMPDLTPYLSKAGDTMAPGAALGRVQAAAEKTVEQRSLQARRARDRVQSTVLAGAGIGSIGGVLLVFLTIGGLVRRLRAVEHNARRLADGEALEPIEQAGDEIGQLAHELTEAAALLTRREAETIAAKDEAERSNQAKTDFLSRMSHELRTPLNSVLGFGQLITMGDARPEDRDSADQIVRAGRHLLGLIDEVLDIARIENGRFRLSIESVHIHEALGETFDLIRPMAERAGIALTADCDESAWAVADRQRLNQVFLNLLSNAIKYNRPGGSVRVTISNDADEVRIDVTDTGPGLDPADVDLLFVPFERLNADELGVEGTGLGLALSKRLVDAMGGRLDVVSRPGEGSTFSVLLQRGEAVDASVAPLPEKRSTPTHPTGGKPVVLYVEDNLANLRLVERVLGHMAPTRLLTALQGGLGFELARDQRPDLILLDLHLPDVHGGDVLRLLKSEEATRHIPVIVITADATSDARNDAMRAGAYACMTKPLDMAAFIDLVESVLSSARSVA